MFNLYYICLLRAFEHIHMKFARYKCLYFFFFFFFFFVSATLLIHLLSCNLLFRRINLKVIYSSTFYSKFLFLPFLLQVSFFSGSRSESASPRPTGKFLKQTSFGNSQVNFGQANSLTEKTRFVDPLLSIIVTFYSQYFAECGAVFLASDAINVRINCWVDSKKNLNPDKTFSK